MWGGARNRVPRLMSGSEGERRRFHALQRPPPPPPTRLPTRHGHTRNAPGPQRWIFFYCPGRSPCAPADGRARWWPKDRSAQQHTLPRHSTPPFPPSVCSNWRPIACLCVCACVCHTPPARRRGGQQPQPGLFLQAAEGILPARAARARERGVVGVGKDAAAVWPPPRPLLRPSSPGLLLAVGRRSRAGCASGRGREVGPPAGRTRLAPKPGRGRVGQAQPRRGCGCDPPQPCAAPPPRPHAPSPVSAAAAIERRASVGPAVTPQCVAGTATARVGCAAWRERGVWRVCREGSQIGGDGRGRAGAAAVASRLRSGGRVTDGQARACRRGSCVSTSAVRYTPLASGRRQGPRVNPRPRPPRAGDRFNSFGWSEVGRKAERERGRERAAAARAHRG